MHDKYLAKNPWLIRYLKFLECISVLLKKIFKLQKQIQNPKKILIINLAHMGDVIISTSILPLVRTKYPQAKIGMLIGTGSKEILAKHPLVDALHFFDHPKLNRSSKPFVSKIFRAFFQSVKLIRDLKQYEISIDLYCYYPNSHFLTFFSRIPRRIGYGSGGGGSLLSDCFSYSYKKQHMSIYHLELLSSLEIYSDHSGYLKSVLSEPKGSSFSIQEPYVIFHPYSGDKAKDWRDEYWSELIEFFKSTPYKIVFTGGSLIERKKIGAIIQGEDWVYNLANKTSFEELLSLVWQSSLLVSVDTMVGHMAAIYDKNSIIFQREFYDSIHWIPASTSTIILDNKITCYSAFNQICDLLGLNVLRKT